jgi:hypothetical protein
MGTVRKAFWIQCLWLAKFFHQTAWPCGTIAIVQQESPHRAPFFWEPAWDWGIRIIYYPFTVDMMKYHIFIIMFCNIYSIQNIKYFNAVSYSNIMKYVVVLAYFLARQRLFIGKVFS